MATGKITAAFAVFRRFNILIRYKMIHDKGDLILIKNRLPVHLFHFVYGYWRGNIISQHQIQIRFDQLSRLYLRKPRVSG